MQLSQYTNKGNVHSITFELSLAAYYTNWGNVHGITCTWSQHHL